LVLGTSIAFAFQTITKEDFEQGRIQFGHMPDNENDGRHDPHLRRQPSDQPIFAPLSTGGFKLFPENGQSYSLYGYFDYPLAETLAMRMPLFMHYDAPNQMLFVNHTSTIHYFKGPRDGLPAQSSICLNFNFMGVAQWSCFDTSAHYSPVIWANNYEAAGVMWTDHKEYRVVSDDDDDQPRAGGRMYGLLKKWTGTPKDHHVAWPKQSKVTMEKYVRGPYAGFIKSWHFDLTFFCGATPQDFHWEFVTAERRRPDTADFTRPSFLPADFSTLPNYAYFPANNGCNLGDPTPP